MKNQGGETSMEKIIRGNIWKREIVNTADIISTEVWLENLNSLDSNTLGKHAMEPIDKDFAKKAMCGQFNIIISGKNFGGGGKSYEHGVIALKAVGIRLVIAESFSRYNFRNSINNGLPVLECAGIFNATDENDELEVNLQTGAIKNLTRKNVLQTKPLPDFIFEILQAGSYTKYTRQRLACKTIKLKERT